MNKIKRFLSVFLAALILLANAPTTSLADYSDYNQGKVSLTFDDGLESVYSKALPILSERGLKATAYITTDFVDQPGYMTWDQVISLQNDYGWEIGSHSVTHLDIEGATLENIIYEVVESLQTLLALNLQVTNFASPFGCYDNNVLAVVAKYYNSHRGFWDRDDLNSCPYNNLVLMTKSIESSTPLSEVYSYIDQAK